MKILVQRDTFTDKSTTGTVYLDGKQFCWSLELPRKDGRPGSCILPGTYKVVTYPSPHFGRLMPLLVGVPLRDPDAHIEIHWLNYPQQSEGCIGVGGTRGKDFIGNSVQMFDDFWAIAQGPMERGECQITITEQEPAGVSLQGDV